MQKEISEFTRSERNQTDQTGDKTGPNKTAVVKFCVGSVTNFGPRRTLLQILRNSDLHKYNLKIKRYVNKIQIHINEPKLGILNTNKKHGAYWLKIVKEHV